MDNAFRKKGKIKNCKLFFYLSIVSFFIIFLLLGLTYFVSIPKLEIKLLEAKKLFLSNIVNTVKDGLLIKIEDYKNNQISKNELDNYLSLNIGKADVSKGYLLANEDGIIINHSNPDRIGKNLKNLIDGNGFKFGEGILDISNTKGKGFLFYEGVNPIDVNENISKVIYIHTFPDNNRIFASTFSMVNIKKEIDKLSSEILYIHVKNSIVIGFLLIIVILLGASFEKEKSFYQRKIANLSNHLPIGVFRLTIDGYIEPLMWNNTTLQLFGLNKKDLSTKKVLLTNFFKNPKDKNLFLKKLKNGIDIERMEIEVKNNFGKYIWVNIEGNIITEGINTYFDGLIEDITERHQIHELLQESYKHLQESDSRKNEIIGITSHELRTPLTIIKGYSSILQTEKLGKLNINQNNYLGKITDNTNKLLLMINDMLDLSKLEAGETIFHEKEFDICDFLEQTYEEFLPKTKLEKINMTLSIPKEETIVKCDDIQLKRVLINLIGNALKFVEENTGKIEIIGKKSENNFTIIIKDNGIGIAKEHIKTVFMKFKQLGNETNTKTKGTGLGLPIVKNIIEKMGSKISIKSTPGKGSEFYFTLKIKR